MVTSVELYICLCMPFLNTLMELAWRSGSVMDCHATAQGSIPGGKGVKTDLHVLRRRQ